MECHAGGVDDGEAMGHTEIGTEIIAALLQIADGFTELFLVEKVADFAKR
jgi:hypothetical protein